MVFIHNKLIDLPPCLETVFLGFQMAKVELCYIHHKLEHA